MRWLRLLPGRLLATTILLGPPVLLGWWIHHRSGWRPSRNGFVAWVADPVTPQTLTAGIAVLAAALWAAAAASIIAALARHLRDSWYRLRRVPLPTPAQATATSIAGVAVLGVPAGALTTSPTGADPTPTSTAMDQGHPPGDHGDAPTWHQTPGAALSHGVDLPDGSWVPEPVAHAIASAASVVWWHRRRWYRPGTSAHHKLTPLPATVTALHTATLATGDEVSASDTTPRPGTDRVLALGDLPARVVLAGPGAYAAARGILVTGLLSNPHNGPRPTLVIPADDLTTLLGNTPGLPPITGLHIVPTLDAALTAIASPAPADTTRPASPADTPLGPRVLITHAPADADRRLTDALNQALPHTAVLFTDSPLTNAYVVDVNGHLHHAGAQPIGTRLCVLSPGAAVDILTVTALATPTPTFAATVDPQPTAHPPTTTPHGHDTASGNHPGLHLQVLGHPQLTHNGVPLPVRRSAAWQALILLTLHPAGATARELIEALWPTLHPHTITQRLYTTISELRTTLRTATGHPVIRRHDDRYSLDRHHIDADVWQLQTAIQHLADSPTPTHRRAALQAVIRAYTGELAAGMPWPWLHVHREVLRRHSIDAYAELADASTPQHAQHLYHEAITVDPLNDDLHQRAIRAMTDHGNHNEATRIGDAYHHRGHEIER